MNVKYVDILIPTKDRAMQLHLLLESMRKHLKGMGRITISWQGSDDDFVAGYELLKKRAMNDGAFTALRDNSKEIIFRRRNSLREVYDAAIESGNSDYIMPLIDDDVFFKSYDLVNNQASLYLFDNQSVLACSIRVGDNLSNQLSSSLADGLVQDKPVGHATSLFSAGKPRFIQINHTHELETEKKTTKSHSRYLKWAWPDNLNVPHWSAVWSTTSQIYRKIPYLKLFETIGRENFLQIEKQWQVKQFAEFLGLPYFLFNILCFTDKLQARFLKRFGIYEQDILQITLSKILYRKRMKQNKKFNVPVHMTAPTQSVVVNLDAGVSHHREGGFGQDVVQTFNQKYLAGKIIAHAEIPFHNVKFATHVFTDFRFIDYK